MPLYLLMRRFLLKRLVAFSARIFAYLTRRPNRRLKAGKRDESIHHRYAPPRCFFPPSGRLLMPLARFLVHRRQDSACFVAFFCGAEMLLKARSVGYVEVVRVRVLAS